VKNVLSQIYYLYFFVNATLYAVIYFII